MASENTRFYDSETLTEVKKVAKADGKGETNATIKHARKMGLLPSVTSIIKIMASPQLVQYRINEAIKACAEFSFDHFAAMVGGAVDVQQYIGFITEKSEEYANQCAEQGTEIHGVINRFLMNNEVPEDSGMKYVCEAITARMKELGVTNATSEKTLGSRRVGWAGTPDIFAKGDNLLWIVDTKSVDIEKFKAPHLSWRLQLGGYRPLIMDDVTTGELPLCDVVFDQFIIDRETKQCQFIPHNDMQPMAEAFQYLYEVWVRTNGYDPRRS